MPESKGGMGHHRDRGIERRPAMLLRVVMFHHLSIIVLHLREVAGSESLKRLDGICPDEEHGSLISFGNLQHLIGECSSGTKFRATGDHRPETHQDKEELRRLA